MNLNSPPSLALISSLFRHPLVLLGGVLLCVTPGLASAQTVTFLGAQTTVFSGGGGAVAVDSSGNLFATIGDSVVKAPKTSTGYGPPIALPFTTLQNPYRIAVDSVDDVFVIDSSAYSVYELPWMGSGYGDQTTLPFDSLTDAEGIAVDVARDVFVINNSDPTYDYSAGSVYELPWNGTGYGPLINSGGNGYNYYSAIASVPGGYFIADTNYQPQGNGSDDISVSVYGLGVVLPFTGLINPTGIAVDSGGNSFVANNNFEGVTVLLELPKTGTSYGPQITLPIDAACDGNPAVDNAGNLFSASCTSIVEFQRHSVDFGSVNFCKSGAPAPCSETVTFNYTVTANGTLGTPKVLTGGAPNLDFTLASGSTCKGSVKAGSLCTVNVTFAPLAAGARNGSVEITDGSGNVLATTAISGFGGTPEVQVLPAYLPFGAVPVGSSKTLPVAVTNAGGGSLTVTTSITGSTNYTIAGSTCSGGLTSGQSCTLQVQFTPTSISTRHDGLLTVQTDDGNPTVGLAGTGSGLSVFGGVNGASLKFGSVSSGSTEVLPLTVTNVGLPGTVMVGTAIKAGYGAGPYSVLTTTENTCLAGIAAGQSCTLLVEFAPTSSGIHDDLLTLTPSAGGGSTTVWLLGSTP